MTTLTAADGRARIIMLTAGVAMLADHRYHRGWQGLYRSRRR